MVRGLIAAQSVSGILQFSSDGGRMLRSWSTMRLKGIFHVVAMTSFPIIFGYVCVFLYQNFFLTF